MLLRSRVFPFLALSIVVSAACDQPLPMETPPPPEADLNITTAVGRPLPLLTADLQRRFALGSVVFQTVFTPETGLGPLFNAEGCVSCHEVPVAGGGGTNDPAEEEEEDVEVHAAAYHGGTCDDLAPLGGPVFQKRVTPALHDALGIDAEAVPGAATATARRTTPDLFGFGLLDAVPDKEVLALADPLDRNHDGISGRPNRTADGRLGRFGRKAQVATLREFNHEAFVMEMGITNPGFAVEQRVGGTSVPPGVDPMPEPELAQDDLDAVDAFVMLLAPPPATPLSFERRRGAMVFRRIGCTSCHVPLLVTGPNPVRALNYQVVPAYTDLLLHDMGPDLADICLGLAEPSEFRTEPLLGLRFATAFLHDGRAATIPQAIRLHGGEAAAARNRFLRLSPHQRAALLKFLRGL